jgi:hypothetical protein
MPDDKKISELTLATALGLSDLMTVVQDGETKRMLLSLLLSTILSDKEIGGSAEGDITTNNALQIMMNKTLEDSVINSPKINDDVECEVTSTLLNLLEGHYSGTAARHQSTDIVHGNVTVGYIIPLLQASIANLTAIATGYTPRYYRLKWTQSGTNKVITEANILTALGLTTGYVVLPGIQVQLWEYDGMSKNVPATGVSIAWYDTETSGQFRLDFINMDSLTNGQVYNLFVTLGVAAVVPGAM